MQLQDSDKMPFGKHKGKQMDEVPATWLDWFSEEAAPPFGEKAKAVLDYIERSRIAIDSELDEKGLIPRRHAVRKGWGK